MEQLVFSYYYYMNLLNTKLKKLNPFDIDDVLERIEKESSIIQQKINKLANTNELLQKDLLKTRNEIQKAKSLLYTIGNTIPDMLWAKNTKGQYIYVNKAFRKEFFYGLSEAFILGKTDSELSKYCKDQVGQFNHTFGDLCIDSDRITLERKDKQMFLEDGKINGEHIYLEVYKNVLLEESKVIGTVGIGRDVTKSYRSLKKTINSLNDLNTPKEHINELENLLNSYRFPSKG